MSDNTHPFPRLILASSSQYRKELLSRLQIPFDVCVPDINETPQAGETPSGTAVRLAKEKATAIAALMPNSVVIGSDQVATLGDEQIGKPGSHENALLQLKKMRGKTVIFHSALCVVDNRTSPVGLHLENVQTSVTFRNLSDEELDRYLKIEQPYDCAGSAKNEGLGIALIQKIESPDPTALTGLPLIALTTMLRQAGVPFFQINNS